MWRDVELRELRIFLVLAGELPGRQPVRLRAALPARARHPDAPARVPKRTAPPRPAYLGMRPTSRISRRTRGAVVPDRPLGHSSTSKTTGLSPFTLLGRCRCAP